MIEKKRQNTIWWMACGYLVSYIPYSLLTKALTSGTLPGQKSTPTGFQILPLAMIGSALVFPLIVTALGWWKYASRTRIFGFDVAVPGRLTLSSGIAFAVEIGATTLAYTFQGISIVFALLLMRGGVLMIAPLVDAFHRRRVRWYSWAALAISFLALFIAFSDVGGYHMTVAALLNLAAYLTAYVYRLRYMTLLAKVADPNAGRRYLVEETLGASIALVAIALLGAIAIPGAAGAELRYGLTTIFTMGIAIPSLLIGVFYAVLAIFGTLVYLNPRENTFAVPVNRGASLLSGVVASWISVWWLNGKVPATSQLIAALVIIVAILFLGIPSALETMRRAAGAIELPDRLFVFVCSGNTSRSPMAQAICNAEVARRLSGSADSRQKIRAVSAGLQIQPGAGATPLAHSTLAQLGLPSLEHEATRLSRDMIRKAEFIFCMTESQRTTVIKTFPEAAWKTFRLDPSEDIEDPSKHGHEVYARVATQLKISIDLHLDSIGLPRVQAASA